MLLLGADEAGKGPVVGSMFVAGLVIEEDRLFDLAGWGVRDSKLLSPAKRESLARKIRSIASDQFIREVKPQVIDELRAVMTRDNIPISLDLHPFRQAAGLIVSSWKWNN